MSSPESEKALNSAFDSTTFNANLSIHVRKDLDDIGSATISPSGRDVAIASKRGLEIIDLDSPLNPPRYLRQNQSWLVADVQWSPFAARENWVASASNQKTLIWNLTMSENSRHGAIEHNLHAHTRAITDINFSAHQADIIATCAVDGYVHCWDLRKPRKPVLTFVDWDAGATQVKWNRQDQHIIASSHDKWLRIWDDRNGAYPLQSIEAHESKIYGVDWNRTRPNGIVTCSLDKSIKFWDYTKAPEEWLERTIWTGFPVWRARHTPFGWGLLAMPQNSPGQLHMYDRRKEQDAPEQVTAAAAVFDGHEGKQVKEFLWRTRGGVSEDGMDNRDFQLVSWGTDNQLRLQHIEAEHLQAVGYVKGSPVRKQLKLTRKGAVYKTFRNTDQGPKDKDKEKMAHRHESEVLAKPGVSVDAAKTMTYSKITPDVGNDERSSRPNSDKKKQLNWMSGIKFNKPLLPLKNGSGRRHSLIGPSYEVDNDWETPESLNDEIVRVHKVYPKVNFDHIDMDKRMVTLSLNGPWGQSGDSTYIKINVKFPEHYPDSKAPAFTIDKSSLIPETVYDKILNTVQQIAENCVARKRGCLKAAVGYLLDVEDMEDIMPWLADSTGLEDSHGIDNLDDSSSEEEEAQAGISTIMSQELDASVSDGTMAASNGNTNAVPVPSVCGARFSANGKLVCFFPPKQENIQSLLGQLHPESESFKRQPAFNTIGRLRDELGPSKSKVSSVAEIDDDEYSYDSDDSVSSSDSDSSRFRLGPSQLLRRPGYRRSLSARGSQKSSTIGTATGTALSKNRISKPKNIVALHDMSPLLPAKRELAMDYAIFNGDGRASVCNHNADVAARHGYNDRADIWRYAAMLLDHEIPLEVAEQSYRQEPILVIAKTMLRRCRRNSAYDSGVDVSFDEKTDSHIKARVKWGDNPLAKPLIEDLFNHFARLADIQMLAMLSCVFSEPLTEYGTSQAETLANQPETPLSMKTPGFSLDYFPTVIAARSLHRYPTYSTSTSTPKAVTPTAAYGSYGSSTGRQYASDPASAPYSTSHTPPIFSGKGSSERLHQIPQASSLSTSPDEKRYFRRGNSGLSTFSLSRPFSATAPSSPPSRKKPSPVEQLLGLTQNGVTWSQNTIFRNTKDTNGHGQHTYHDDDFPIHQDNTSNVTGIVYFQHNMDLFDDESSYSTPLLASSTHSPLFDTYRAAYAEILFAWGLPFDRLELLKYGGLPDYFSAMNAERTVGMPAKNGANLAGSVRSIDAKTITHDSGPPIPIPFGKKDSIDKKPQSDQGLDIRAFCLKHEDLLIELPFLSASEPLIGGAPGRCERCAREQRQLRCVVCQEPVNTAYAPCLSCGCVSHQQCLQEYQAESEYEGICAGGCECDCRKMPNGADKNIVVESWEVLMGAIGRSLKASGIYSTDNAILSPDSDKEMDWETVDGSRDLKKAENGQSTSGRSTPVQAGTNLAYGHWRRGIESMRGSGPDWGKRKPSSLREI